MVLSNHPSVIPHLLPVLEVECDELAVSACACALWRYLRRIDRRLEAQGGPCSECRTGEQMNVEC